MFIGELAKAVGVHEWLLATRLVGAVYFLCCVIASEKVLVMCRLSAATLILACAFLIRGVSGQVQSDAADRAFARAIQLHQAGDIEGAIREYQVALAINPNRIDARSNLGAAYARLGHYEEAIREYKWALLLDNQNATIRFNLALAYYKAAYISEAAEELNRVILAQPKNKNAIFLLADCNLQLGEYKKVIELLSPLEVAYGNDRALAYMLGTALIRTGQIEKGQLWIDRVLRDGDSAEARVLMGTAHMMARDYPSALKELERAIELSPKLPQVHSLYGQILLKMGDRDRAIKAFQDELAIAPSDFAANLYLGVLLKQDQKNEQALAHFQRALMVRPRDFSVRYFIGSLYLALGRTAEAQRVLEELVKEVPDFVEAHVSLATAYYRLKRKEDGDRERAIIEKLNAERQARAPGAQEGLGPAYRGEKVPDLKLPQPYKQQ
jgi:tetratricopeptide (TPR) repeat protein